MCAGFIEVSAMIDLTPLCPASTVPGYQLPEYGIVQHLPFKVISDLPILTSGIVRFLSKVRAVTSGA